MEQIVFFNIDSSTIEAFAIVDGYQHFGHGAPACVYRPLIVHCDQLASPVYIEPSTASSMGLFALGLHHEAVFLPDVDALLAVPALAGLDSVSRALAQGRTAIRAHAGQRGALAWLRSFEGRRQLALDEELAIAEGSPDPEEVGEHLEAVPSKWGRFAITTRQKASLLFLLNSLFVASLAVAPPLGDPAGLVRANNSSTELRQG